MAPTKIAILDWKGVLAAMVYLATFVAAAFAVYATARDAPFLESFVSAYPFAFLASGVLFCSCAAVEAIRATLRKSREAHRMGAPSSASPI